MTQHPHQGPTPHGPTPPQAQPGQPIATQQYPAPVQSGTPQNHTSQHYGAPQLRGPGQAPPGRPPYPAAMAHPARLPAPVPATRAGSSAAGVLLLASGVLALISMVLPWLRGSAFDSSSGSGGIRVRSVTWNGLTWAAQGVKVENTLGYLLVLALILALTGALLAIGAGILALGAKSVKAMAVAAAVIGLVATLGTMGTVVVLSEGHLKGFQFGFFVFGLSFLPALLGAILAPKGRR